MRRAGRLEHAADRAELAASKLVVEARSKGRCEHPDGCGRPAVLFHHRAGRVGEGCHAPELLAHLCNDHHVQVHASPAASYADGMMVKRLGRAS